MLALFLIIGFSVVYSYINTIVRLEHFSFLFVMIGVAINGYFLWALIKQIQQGGKSLEQAREANEESRRARVDSRSISLVPIIEFDGLAFSREDEGSLEVGDSVGVYTIPKDNNTKVVFRAFGELKNEGLVTAQVMTSGNITFDDGVTENSDLIWKSNLHNGDEKILLSPGESRRFVWCDGHTVKEWLDARKRNHEEDNFDENSSCKMQFRAWDFQHNVYEYVDIEVQGYPLEIDSQDSGKAILSPKGLGYTVYPVQRLYGEAERTKYKDPYSYRRSEK